MNIFHHLAVTSVLCSTLLLAASAQVSHIPEMTSNTSPSGTVTRSGVYSSSYEAWLAFESGNSQWISQTWQSPAWITYEWSDGPRMITEYAIKFANGSLRSRAPRDWTLQGWDGSSWDILDTRNNQGSWGGVETRTFAVASPGSYYKYRLHVTKDNDNRADIVVVSIAHLDLLGPPCGYSISQVPQMTSNNSPSGTVTRSGVYSSSYEAWLAFESGNSQWISQTWQSPAWIAYEWSDGPRMITEYAIKFANGSLRSRAPRDWTLQGWDGSSWNVVDTRNNQGSWGGVETRTFSVASPGSYSKYRLHVTQDNDDRADIVVISIAHLDLFGPQCGCTTAPVSQVPQMTSNNSPSGTITRSGVYSSSYEAWLAFESSNSQWISQTWQSPAWIAYEWSDGPRMITEYSIKFANGSLRSRAPRDWTLQGWDGSSWDIVDTRINEIGWAGVETRTFPVASPGSYSKYRLHVTQDNDNRADIVVVSIAHLDLVGPQCECTMAQVDQVPEMTSNNSPSGTVTRSGVYSSSYEAWRAFESGNSQWISQTWQSPAWIAYEWSDGPRTITEYSIKFANGSLRGRAPRDWTLQGWDGSSWVIVDSRAYETNWGGVETRTFAVSSPGSYSKYRLHVTQDNDRRADIVVVSIAHLQLLEESCD